MRIADAGATTALPSLYMTSTANCFRLVGTIGKAFVVCAGTLNCKIILDATDLFYILESNYC